MSDRLDIDRSLAMWLAQDAPVRAPGRVLEGARDRIQTTRQHRPWWAPRIDFADVGIRLAVGSAAVVALLLAVDLVARDGGRVASPSGLPTPSIGPSRSPAPTASTGVSDYGPLRRGEHEISWPGGPGDARIRVTIPAVGWSWIGSDRSTIYRDHGRLYGFPADLATHTVSQVVTSVCGLDEASGEVGPIFKDVGPTVDDLVEAIAAVGGTSWSGPVDVVIGGRAGKRLVTTYRGSCAGPARRTIWEGPTGNFFVEQEMRSTIDILDVDGDPLVLTSNLRTDNPDVARELDDILSSIAIARDQPRIDHPTVSGIWTDRTFPRAVGPDGDVRIGRHRAVAEGIPFTFVVRESGWEPQRGFYLSRSITGPQGAEGTIRWTTIPNGEYTEPCQAVLDDSAGKSVSELADAVARAPGIEVIDGPMNVTVGGRPAMHAVLRVANDRGCDPGYFYTYDAVDGGALWLSTDNGDVISVWIVDVDEKILFIEAQATVSAWPIMEGSFRQMVDSMAFE